MSIKTVAVLTTAIATWSVAASAEQYVTSGDYVACISEDAYDEATKALAARDQQWFKSIRGCVITNPGLKLTIVDRGFSTSKVRIFTPDGNSMVLWTPSENIKRR